MGQDSDFTNLEVRAVLKIWRQTTCFMYVKKKTCLVIVKLKEKKQQLFFRRLSPALFLLATAGFAVHFLHCLYH